MPRPRRLNVDTLMGFNCSYVLKVAIIRTAEIIREETPSSLMRRVTEEYCRRIMGEEQWTELSRGASSERRQERLAQFLKGRRTRRLRDVLAREGTAETVVLLAELDIYARDFERERDEAGQDLVLRVALHEAVDVLLKIKVLLQKGNAGKQASILMELTRHLARPLQDDVDAAVRAMIERDSRPK